MTTLGPFGYEGGWNTKSGPYSAPPNSIVDGQNMELIYSRMSKKKGNIQWTSGAHPGGSTSVNGVTFFDGVLVGCAGAKIATASATSSGGAWSDITGVVAFSSNQSTWMQSLNNILVMGNFSGATVQWSGSGNITALSAAPQNVTAAATVNNYLFTGNLSNGTVPYRVQWSAVSDPTTWPAANFVDVIRDDSTNNSITALLAFGEDLLIFKNNSVSRFFTNQISGSLGPLITVSDKYGCAGTFCADRLPDGRVAFIGTNNHIYIYDGNTFEDISDPPAPSSNIQLTLNSLSFGSGVFGTGFLRVYQSRNQIWASYPLTFTNALGTAYVACIFIYDYINRCWMPPYVDHQVHSAVNYISTNHEFLITGGHDGFLYREDSGDTNSDSLKNSTAFDGYFTKSIAFGNDNRAFIPRSAYFGLSTGNLTATAYWGSNGNNNPTLTKAISITASAQERKIVVPITTSSKVWNTGQFRFDGAVSNQPFAVAPFYLSDEIESQT